MSYENEEICFSYGICMFFGLSELVLDLQCRMKNNFSVKPFFVCKFTFRLQPAMLPVVFVVRMLSPPALEHRSPVKQPHFVSILCFFASIAFHVNP